MFYLFFIREKLPEIQRIIASGDEREIARIIGKLLLIKPFKSSFSDAI